MKSLQIIFLLGIIALFSACASQSALSGGERDVTPPKLASSLPQTGSVNIIPQQIDFEFDEFIQIKSLNQKLIVSPPLKYQPKLKQRAKGFSLILKDTLKPNTTYNFYFGDAIQDLNESNPLSDFSYVFSTGSEIDTLKVSGIVNDAFTLKPEKEFLVALYKDTTDSVPLKTKPDYITRTNASGIFHFNFIKSGQYKIVGFSDKNSNYQLEPENEKIAFLKNNITVLKGKDSLNLFAFSEDRTKQFIKKAERKIPCKAEIIFNTISDIKPSVISDSIKVLDYFSSVNNDTLWVFLKDSLQYFADTVKLKIKYSPKDSLQNFHTIIETRAIKWTGKDKYKADIPVSYQWNIKDKSKINSKEPVSIIFNEPALLESKAIEICDSANIPIQLSMSKDSLNLLKWNIETRLIDGKKYRLTLNQEYIKSLYSHSVKNDTIHFETLQSEDFANLKLNIKLPENDNYIIELLSEKGDFVKSWKLNSSSTLNIEQILPGKYTLRAFSDANNNGKWDSGFYILHQQPENVYYYNQTFQLRANWDLEVNWAVK